MVDGVRRVLVVFGTRPEAIKLMPVVFALRERGLHAITCATGQHRDLVVPVCHFFGVGIDHDLRVGEPALDLSLLAARVQTGVAHLLDELQPDHVIVQGDTTSALAAALAAFHARVPVWHVEAGLRTGNMAAPFPEEMNRVLIARLASRHLAPTEAARANLLAEGIPGGSIEVTGNTVVDAARHGLARLSPADASTFDARHGFDPVKPLVLFTMHRREAQGAPAEGAMRALAKLCRDGLIQLLCPVHPSPRVRAGTERALAGVPAVRLVAPLSYPDMLLALQRSRLVLTDSGGLVEEAACLGRPALVLREETERPEVLAVGGALLVGHAPSRVGAAMLHLLADESAWRRMAAAPNPFGDGWAADRIAMSLAGAGARRLPAAA